MALSLEEAKQVLYEQLANPSISPQQVEIIKQKLEVLKAND